MGVEDSVTDNVTPSVGSRVDLLDAINRLLTAAEDIISHGPDTWDRLSPHDAQGATAKIERARKMLGVADAAFITGYEPHFPVGPQRRIRLLSRIWNVGVREARVRHSSCTRISERTDPWSADPSAPHPEHMPCVAAQVARGEMDHAAVAKVDKQIRDLPEQVQTEITRIADGPISDLTRKQGPDVLDKLRPFLLDLVGAEEPYTEKDHQRMRSLTLGKQGTDGMTQVRGVLTPEVTAVMQRLMADHAKTGDLWAPDDRREDDRTPEQRRHDALGAVLNSGYGPGKELSTSRGATTIVAVMSVDQVASGAGSVLTDTGTHVPAATLLSAPENLNAYLQILDFEGRTLYLGRSRRLGSLDQYLALVGEEGMSSAPGSDAPPAHCHIHHIDDWHNGGMTDIDNLTFASPDMHALVDDSRQDEDRWWTEVSDRGSGRRVDWVPPVSIDPDRTPIHNDHPTTWRHPGAAHRRTHRDGKGQGGRSRSNSRGHPSSEGDDPPVT